MTEYLIHGRLIVWFSCGAASAVAAKLAIELYGPSMEVLVVNCDTRINEHPDNYRFSAECEKWFGQPIIYIRNENYETIDDVFMRDRYMAGIGGARCTAVLKKRPRQEFQRSDDVHVFGYTSEETKRMRDFENNNPELKTMWILKDAKFTKQKCHDFIRDAGISAPAMYALGFKNNNCMGCVKASSPRYWALVRKVDPETFNRRAKQSRELGVRLVLVKHKPNVRIFLDELPYGVYDDAPVTENVSCGPECGAP